MEVFQHNRHAQYFVIAVVLSLLLLYTAFDKTTQQLDFSKLVQVLVFSDVTHSLRELNKVAALAAIGLVSFAFIFGPLSRLWPKKFGGFLAWRKTVGVWGFVLAALHAVYSLIDFYKLDLNKMFFENQNVNGLIFGFFALFIFFLMTITSTSKSVQRMGYPAWKKLQTTGYLALLLAILHFIILETKPVVGLQVRPYGLLFLYLAIAALGLRMIMILIHPQPKTAPEQHVQLPTK